MATAQPALHISRLTKTIAGREIFTSCDLAVAPGEICAIIGPNGAGKTTLFKTIVGLAFPSSGTITILGQTPACQDGMRPPVHSKSFTQQGEKRRAHQ